MLVLAGGMGTRLGFLGPKGCFPITPVRKKTLFQLLAEKTKAASCKYGTPIPVAIMTSPSNDASIQAFFRERDYFGLSSKQIFFFSQDELPLLDERGHLFFQKPGKLAQGPDGNGSVFRHFFAKGVGDTWKDLGVQHILVLPIDNPLADPFDVDFLGYHAHVNANVSLKCIRRSFLDDKMGLLACKEDGSYLVLEYSEEGKKLNFAKDAVGELVYPYANTGLFAFSFDFTNEVKRVDLPWHLAHKAISFWTQERGFVEAGVPNAWKYETFIFDLLAYARHVAVVEVSKESNFAPLKGQGDVKDVQSALMARDRRLFFRLFGKSPPKGPLEFDPRFHYFGLSGKEKTIESDGYIAY